MTYKPLPLKKYLQYLRILNWTLEKAGFDWNLRNEKGHWLCSIIIAHGKKTKEEVIAYSVKKTENLCKERGIQWPPKKK